MISTARIYIKLISSQKPENLNAAHLAFQNAKSLVKTPGFLLLDITEDQITIRLLVHSDRFSVLHRYDRLPVLPTTILTTVGTTRCAELH